MTTRDPVDRVADYLERNGFRRLPSPLVINRMAFKFPAVLGGAEKSSDLILVVDTVNLEDAEIVRQVLGVARALDVARSSNPLTTVIVGPRPKQDILEELIAVCRVLPLGTIGDGEEELVNWLAVLTPLNEIDANGIVADPIAELRQQIEDLPDEIRELLKFSSPDAVEEGVNVLLAIALEKAWEMDK